MSQQSFNKLLASLSTQEREQLMKVGVAYGLSTDDPAWLVLALNQSGLLSVQSAIKDLHQQRKIELMNFNAQAKSSSERL